MKKPNCRCFAPGEATGENICFSVAAETARYFIGIATREGVCGEAIYHAALTAIIVILDGVGSVQTSMASVKSELASEEQFQVQALTLIEDLNQRRAELNAWLARQQGVSLQ